MSWFEAVPTALAAVAWLLGPGLVLTWAVGLRGLSALGMAPTFSLLVVSITAVAGQKAGISWSIWLVLVVTAVLAALALLASLLLRRVARPRASDPARTLLVSAAGILPAVVIAWFVVVNGMGEPDQLSQTYDAIFHYSAVSYILDSGSASSLTMASLGNPGTPATFYPAGWHGVTSLVVLTTGAEIATAANLVAWAIAGVVWPVGCLVLVRQIVGRNTAAMFITPLLAVTFTAFPWGLLSFGVLWPNLLAVSLVPAGLAAVLAATRLATDDVIGIRRSFVLAPMVLIATAFAHPNAVFSLAVLALFPLGTVVLRYALEQHREGRTLRGVLVLGGSLAALFAVWYFLATTGALKGVREQYWPPFETPAMAVGETLLNATNGRPALWALSALTLVGLVVAWRTVNRRWLVGAVAATTALFTITAALNRPGTQMFTGYWYNDSYRLAAMLPITGVPLAVLAVLLIAGKIGDRLPANGRFPLLRTPTALTLLVTLALVPLTKGLYFQTNVDTIATNYRTASKTDGTLVDQTELAFLPELGASLPKGAYVANNPWDGSAMMLAEVRRKPVFGHVLMDWNKDQKYLAEHLREASTDQEVCAAAGRIGVQYMLVANKTFMPKDDRVKAYPGIGEPRGTGAFELVASEGSVKLYRLDKCGTASKPTS
ncbi:hypothetical protein GCM10011609_42760 [Lentzea pudingi]|uniref:Uncharacterized protein n=1 Tax=Lentzea pudingi TaxID=1789439 RepID=A0ABQ2I622_9PSEU|nr:DUF6541 family protein [Lentzea pudingi]GGM99853.1 hypothetical protein GCM10011609_42760 [Lentzea pudingi]